MKFQHLSISILFILFSLTLPAQTVSYSASSQDIVNPDRGFYFPIYPSGEMGNFTPLNAADLADKRQNFFSPGGGAGYQIRTGLFFRYYILDNSTDNLGSFPSQLQQDFDAVRQAGGRLIIRFAYTITPNTSCGQAACPPYGDAPKARVLSHIAQLAPVLQTNEDVISVVQNGFIGVWGEQYYTDYFGDASQSPYKLFDNNWQDRIDVLSALLDAVPTNRIVQVRYPQMKQKYVYGINAPVTSLPMTAAQAHDGSDIARLGFHNDCFLSSPDDFGTYYDYGTSATSSSSQTAILKPYFGADAKYNAAGGETCGDGYSPQNDCSGMAVSDMATLHYSYLNAAYNNDVNNDWVTGNCMDEIKQKLGYRLVMLNGTYPATASAGTNISFTLNLENVGFAAPYNERELELVLRNTSTQSDYKVNINGTNTDTRFWHTGTVTMTANAMLPATLPTGTYDLFLHILDPSNNNAIANRPEYSIQLANTGTWEASTGFNRLNHTLTVGQTPPPSNSGCITIDGDFSDWGNIDAISTSGSNGLNSLKAADQTDTLYIHATTNLHTNYQLYIDSDNNNSGSNEYTDTNWFSTGFNYMIENGSLFAYTGTGADWSWNFVATVNAVKNASGLELEIDKSLLSAGTIINIGLAGLDGAWNEVAHIPTGSNAAAYTLNSSLICSDICVVTDGDFSDWSLINTISTSGSNGLNTLKAADSPGTLHVHAATNINTNYQLYIDSDNNNSGSNEYTNTNWFSMGFNFMIENGSLFAYTGTGADWSWNFVATVNAVKNASGLELEVDKSLLGASTTINIGLAALDAAWNEVGHIPTGSNAAAYTFTSTLNCNNSNPACNTTNLTLQGALNNSVDYETDGSISSTQVISGNNTVGYDSGTLIQLNSGFSTSSTVNFSAFIDGCGGLFRQQSSNVVSQPHQPMEK